MPTKTNKTIQQYLVRANNLHRIAFEELSSDYPEMYEGKTGLDPLQLAVWVDEKRKSGIYSKSTFRTHKSCVMCYIERLPEAAKNKYEAIDFLSGCYNDGSPKTKIKRTSARKLKGFKNDDLATLLAWLTTHSGKWNALCAMWLKSTVLTGLRPSEWANAQLIEYEISDSDLGVLTESAVLAKTALEKTTALRVLNGKNSNGRANGDYRTIVLAHLEQAEIEMITKFVASIDHLCAEVMLFDALQNYCRVAINYANKKAFPRRKNYYSLYSARHQFSANMKASGIGKAELAALMGHAEALTATKHYARAGIGTMVSGVIVKQDEVATVRTASLEKSIEKANKLPKGLDGAVKLKRQREQRDIYL